MNFDFYLNNYSEAVHMPQKEYHAYCMEMRKAAPEAVQEALQMNYRCLILAIKQQELRDKEKEERKRDKGI